MRFTDSNGDEWAYEGELVEEDFSNQPRQIAVRGDELEYVDENGDLRRAPRTDSMGDRNTIKQVIVSDSQIHYVYESGNERTAFDDVAFDDFSDHSDDNHSNKAFDNFSDESLDSHEDKAFSNFSDHDDATHDDFT